MNKPFVFICGTIVAYSLWRIFIFPSKYWPFHKSIKNDDQNVSEKEKKESQKQSCSNSECDNTLLSSSECDDQSNLLSDDNFTIISSHAYDLSEEDEVASHRDSYNESNLSFVRDSSIDDTAEDSETKPKGYSDLNV